jgi:GAF domain-containing protein
VRLAVLDGERLLPLDGEPLVEPTGGLPAAASPYVLADFPTARLVLAERTISQVFAGTVRADAAEKRLLDATGCRSMLLLPLVSGGRAVGLLECFHTEERPWGRGQLRVARMVAAALGPVIGSLVR